MNENEKCYKMRYISTKSDGSFLIFRITKVLSFSNLGHQGGHVQDQGEGQRGARKLEASTRQHRRRYKRCKRWRTRCRRCSLPRHGKQINSLICTSPLSLSFQSLAMRVYDCLMHWLKHKLGWYLGLISVIRKKRGSPIPLVCYRVISTWTRSTRGNSGNRGRRSMAGSQLFLSKWTFSWGSQLFPRNSTFPEELNFPRGSQLSRGSQLFPRESTFPEEVDFS